MFVALLLALAALLHPGVCTFTASDIESLRTSYQTSIANTIGAFKYIAEPHWRVASTARSMVQEAGDIMSANSRSFAATEQFNDVFAPAMQMLAQEFQLLSFLYRADSYLAGRGEGGLDDAQMSRLSAIEESLSIAKTVAMRFLQINEPELANLIQGYQRQKETPMNAFASPKLEYTVKEEHVPKEEEKPEGMGGTWYGWDQPQESVPDVPTPPIYIKKEMSPPAKEEWEEQWLTGHREEPQNGLVEDNEIPHDWKSTDDVDQKREPLPSGSYDNSGDYKPVIRQDTPGYEVTPEYETESTPEGPYDFGTPITSNNVKYEDFEEMFQETFSWQSREQKRSKGSGSGMETEDFPDFMKQIRRDNNGDHKKFME